MAAVDMNRLSNGITLNPKASAAIWQDTLESSAIMALTPHITLPGTGISIQTITGDPEAAWVAETEEKPVGDSTFATKIITPYKAAIIELFSEELVRDAGELYRQMRARLPFALGRLLDATVLYGTAPGSNFDVLSDAQSVTITKANTADDLLEVNSLIAASGNRLSGWGLSPQGEALVMGAAAPGGGFAFVNNLSDTPSIGRILGQDVYSSKALFKADAVGGDIVGIAGDWSQARVGTVDGIKMKFTDQATVNKAGVQVNTWQRNMVGVLVEAEFGFVVNNKAAFRRLRAEIPTP